MVSFVLTIIGPDRVGIVQKLSRAITAANGNWVESRMSQLAGKFAGLLRVDVPADNAQALLSALEDLPDLRVVVERAEASGPSEFSEVVLNLMGADHPGIVHQVAQVLAALGVNVEELNTECIPAPMTGEPLFQATVTLNVPPSVSLDTVCQALEEIASDLMVDVSVERGEL